MRFPVRRGSVATFASLLLAITTLSGVLTSAHSLPPARSAYVVGSGDGSITRVDLDTGDVVANLATVGSGANRVAVLDDLTRVFVANSGSDDVTVFDSLAETVIGTFDLPGGANPWAATVAGGRLFVTGLQSNSVYEFSLGDGSLLNTIPVGKSPEGMCVVGTKLFVTNTGFDFGTFAYDPGTVSVIDLGTSTVTRTVSTALNPQECFLAPDGTVHVVCTGDFFLTQGQIDVLDPGSETVVDSFAVAGFPGGAALGADGVAYLNVTNTAFGSEIQSYDATTRTLIRDETDPLLPTFDFYGNPRSTSFGKLLVPNFAQDLLLVEDPSAPGAPSAYLVGDQPIDTAVIERENPVPLVVSGLFAALSPNGIELKWRGALESNLFGFRVERRQSDRAWEPVAELSAARETAWVDTDVTTDETYTYRVGAVGFDGTATWSLPISFTFRRSVDPRLAIARATPNPSRTDVELSFVLPRAEAVALELLDVRGRRVLRRDLGRRGAGAGTWTWDGRLDDGRLAAPGMYFARITAGGASATQRLLRVR